MKGIAAALACWCHKELMMPLCYQGRSLSSLFLFFGCVSQCADADVMQCRLTEAEPWAGQAANQLLPIQCGFGGLQPAVEPLTNDSANGWLSSLLEAAALLDQAFKHDRWAGWAGQPLT